MHTCTYFGVFEYVLGLKRFVFSLAILSELENLTMRNAMKEGGNWMEDNLNTLCTSTLKRKHCERRSF